MTPSTSTPSPGADRPAGGPVSRLSPRDALLVLIDVQNDFCHPRGTMGRRGMDLSAVPPAVANAQLLLAAARDAGVPPLFVRTVHGERVDSDAWRHRYAAGIGTGERPAPGNCLEGSWGAEFYRLRPRPGESVAVKHRYSAFGSPGFRAALAAHGRPALVLAGVTTNVCVESTLRSAVDADHLASVVSDACAAYDAAEHAAAVTVMARHFGRSFTTADVVAHWRRERPATPETRETAETRKARREEVRRDG
ncbi:cysteine hydrolase family protein [Streptomyces johnsoniae]|uniref:Isochorismatase family cysteine hydrolase n=1 Tax=Streptomyces johnsoniae TaxID=3075532 RepID=A0ABU2S5X1_9ACTN|nr:isochorismatase family cysteine hydrolase [Streptomyces sp. DSM 41886]MDT0444368.1 isochorismatase family cysteine hydrolase [Streptomyces sp. DSM 41886]